MPIVLACKKNPPLHPCQEHPENCVDVREVKDYFYFKLGSWWLYEEENSGKRDSVYVIETFSDPANYYFKTILQSSYDGYNYPFWTNSVTGDRYNNLVEKATHATTVKRAKGKPGDFVAESYCFMFYPYIGKYLYNNGGAYISGNELKVGNVLSDFSILDKTFENVVVMTEDYTAIEESQPTVHYYAPNIGLIRKELLDSNQVWNLIDYHIIE